VCAPPKEERGSFGFGRRKAESESETPRPGHLRMEHPSFRPVLRESIIKIFFRTSLVDTFSEIKGKTMSKNVEDRNQNATVSKSHTLPV
jgi:hypothetical protein